MDRHYELEDLRRSIVMLNPHAPNALNREKAIALIEELQVTGQRLRRLREGIGKLLEEDDPLTAPPGSPR